MYRDPFLPGEFTFFLQPFQINRSVSFIKLSKVDSYLNIIKIIELLPLSGEPESHMLYFVLGITSRSECETVLSGSLFNST